MKKYTGHYKTPRARKHKALLYALYEWRSFGKWTQKIGVAEAKKLVASKKLLKGNVWTKKKKPKKS